MSAKIGNWQIWNRLTGDREHFSMENRAFNYVSLITFPILLYCMVFDMCIGQLLMAYILAVLQVALGFLYYLSRYKKRYYIGIVMYIACSYLILILNYYINSGIKGPTVSLFFLTFQLLIAIGKPRHYIFWICLHTTIVMGLLYSEYANPALVPWTYLSRIAWFWDIGSCYVISIAFIFVVTNYLRQSFIKEKQLAEERLAAIVRQNEQIMAQNALLEQVNEEKNKLFSIISHDLKSPLDSISGYLVLLSEHKLDQQEKTLIEDELREQTKYTSDLLLNLLTWARNQMHGVVVNLQALRIRELVDESADNKRSVAAKKGIKLTYAIDPTLEVIGDKDMLRIVLRNLINNALKFTPTGGEIQIKAISRSGDAEISVKDNGIGIPSEKQADLFTLKTRSSYGTNNEKGIGLGLLMCKEFMELQHGTIGFSSIEGVGSVFFCSLPRAKA